MRLVLRRSCISVLVLAAAGVASSNSLDALQSVGEALSPGARARALDSEGHELGEGFLGDVTPDAIHLQSSDGELHALSRSDVSTLEMYAGSHRRWLAGGAIGLGAGLGILAAREFFASACAVSVNDDCLHSRSRYLLPDTDASLIVGAAVLLGTAVGGLIRSDRWRAVPWPTLLPGVGQKGAIGRR